MIQFVIIITLILALVLFFLLRALLRNNDTRSYARNEQNIHFAQERLKELEAQLKNASISAVDYEALKQEIEHTLIDDLKDESKPVDAKQASKTTAIILGILIPIAACCIYLIIGNPGSINYQQQIEQLRDPQNLMAMLEDIEQRLQQQPEDEKGWSILGNTYLATGQFAKAQQAYRKLLELQGHNAQTLVKLADAIAQGNKGNMTGEPEQLVRKALTLNPHNKQALWMAGIAALQNNQPEKAKLHWQKLLPMLADAPAQQQELMALIKRTEQSNQQEVDSAKVIEVQVSIDQSLLEQTQPDNIVFIFAKASGDNAPRAPLAVKRLTVANLPAKVTLSDVDAMMPQLTISKFDNIVVSARVSKSGDPIAKSGDLESDTVSTNSDSSVELTIHKKL